MTETNAEASGLNLLRKPFPANQISKLPKPTKQQTEEVKADFKKGIRCDLCGSWHHPKVVHLDYVGHAALTDRLLDADPNWTWEPLAMHDGLPVFDGFGGMWIRLTVCGVTRLGYGHAGDKSGGDAIKEVIGDALRNAAMRFGAALDLWHKGDLHTDEPKSFAEAANQPETPATSDPLSSFSPAWAKNFRAAVADAIEHFNKGDEMAAFEDVSSMIDKYAVDANGQFDSNRDTMARMAVWAMLRGSSGLRSAIKRIEAEQRAMT